MEGGQEASAAGVRRRPAGSGESAAAAVRGQTNVPGSVPEIICARLLPPQPKQKSQLRRACLRRMAAERPAGPAPTTTTSYSAASTAALVSARACWCRCNSARHAAGAELCIAASLRMQRLAGRGEAAPGGGQLAEAAPSAGVSSRHSNVCPLELQIEGAAIRLIRDSGFVPLKDRGLGLCCHVNEM